MASALRTRVPALWVWVVQIVEIPLELVLALLVLGPLVVLLVLVLLELEPLVLEP